MNMFFINLLASHSGSSSDTTYQALLAYATANGITKPTEYQSAIVEAGFRIITQNVGWNKIAAMWLLCAPNTGFGYLNVVNPGTYTLTVTGTMTHTANQGILSANTSSWLGTGYTAASFGIGGISQTGTDQISTLIGRNNGGTTIDHIIPHHRTNGTFYGQQSTQINQALESNDGGTTLLNYGAFHTHHDGTNVDYFYNGKLETSTATAKGSAYAAEYFISATNHPTTKYVNTTHNIAVAYICSSLLTDDEVWYLHAGINLMRMGMAIGSEATPATISTPAWFTKSAVPKVYFIWGQSNAYGNVNNSGVAEYQDAVPNAYVMPLDSNYAQWSLLLDQNINKRLTAVTTRFGIEQKLARLINAPTFYIKYAADGMPLSPNLFDVSTSNNFYPPPSGANSGLFYNNVKKAFLNAKNEILREFTDAEWYFIGIHGEADGLSSVESQLYDDYFTTFLSTLETDLGITFDGVYLSKLPSGMESYVPTIYVDNINTCLDNLLTAGTIDALIDTEDCTLQGDNLHYDRAGLDQLATNFYNSF